ncbi:MAG: TetR/AcrR family transcriptional regulator [Sphingomicrobium sp.]
MGRRGSDKKQRLIEAAADRFHRDGLNASSIADIARDARVPAGNVYYYFRAKDDLVRAVVGHWIARIGASLEALLPDHPADQRLEAFLDGSGGRADYYAQLGCPLVSLARDLRQSGGDLAPLAASLLRPQIDWLESVLAALGPSKREQSRTAQELLATLQGSLQMAYALNDPAVIHATVAQLKAQAITDRHVRLHR